MKKRAVWALGLLVVAIVATVTVFAQSGLKVEQFSWTMATIQDQQGHVTACSPDDASRYPEAQEQTLFCSAKGSKLTLKSDQKESLGTYRLLERNLEGRIYQLEIDGLGQGYAVCAYTKLDNGRRLPTLVMTFPQSCTLTFTGITL